MPTTPIQRLLFSQGGNCFFCRKKLSKAEASVEHLVALTHGGKDSDENCVACCKALNSLFGRMSLKEKLQIVLNQRGNFVCPSTYSIPAACPSASPPPKGSTKIDRSPEQRLDVVVADLHKRGNARPGTAEKLRNTIRSLMAGLGESPTETDAQLRELEARGYVKIDNGKVLYLLPTPAKPENGAPHP